MSTATTPTYPREFVLRRLHSLSGVIPIGVFLIMHLTVNSMILFSRGDADLYQSAVDRIHALGPFVKPVSLAFIMLPIAFHAILGIKIWRESKPNVGSYGFWCNWRYTIQRITGVIVLVFILVHLWHMSWVFEPVGRAVSADANSMFLPEQASATAAHAMQSQRWWVIPIYTVGIVSACYHLATGLWTFLITWGITVGSRAQYRAGWVCAAFGVFLGLVGLSAQVGFLLWPEPVAKTRLIEQAPVTSELPPPVTDRMH